MLFLNGDSCLAWLLDYEYVLPEHMQQALALVMHDKLVLDHALCDHGNPNDVVQDVLASCEVPL